MKQEALFYVKNGTIYDNKNRLSLFRGVTYIQSELFPMEEANSRFNKLLIKGCNLIRWFVSWETVEPEPEAYNEEYLADLRNLLKKAEEHNINVIIEPTGIPSWVCKKIGMSCDSSICEKTNNPWGWKTEETFAERTIYTMFFAGHTYAKGLKIDGDPVQDYLQEHFINAKATLEQKIF